MICVNIRMYGTTIEKTSKVLFQAYRYTELLIIKYWPNELPAINIRDSGLFL